MPPPQKQDVAIRVTATGDVTLAGLSVFTGPDNELIAALDKLIKQGQPSLVVTSNVDHCIDLSQSTDLWSAYEEASLRTLDGMPLVWLATLAGADNVHRQTGADMLIKCVEAAASREWRVVVLGGLPEANDSAVRQLRLKFPGSDVVGHNLPFSVNFETDEIKSSVRSLSVLQPDIVFVCLGSPKQERFFMELRAELPPAVYVGAGAAVDFAGGMKLRAPRTIQKLGLEWLWRLIQEPRRLAGRYLIKGTALGRITYNTVGEKRN